jgi:hypothetical protein
MPRSLPRTAAGIRPGSSSPPRLKTTTNSSNILLVSYCLRAVRGRHRESAGGGQLPGVTGREQALAIIGLIIVAVVLMALMVLGVSGIRWKLPVPMPAAGPDRAAPGYRGVTS